MNSRLVVCGRKVNPLVHNKVFSLGSPGGEELTLPHKEPHTHALRWQGRLSPEEHVDLSSLSGAINHLLLAWFINPLESSGFTEACCGIRAGGLTSGRRKSHIPKNWVGSNSKADAMSLFSEGPHQQRGELLCLKSAVIIHHVTASPSGEADHLPHQERKWLKRRADLLFHQRSVTPALPKVSVSRSHSVCVWSN